MAAHGGGPGAGSGMNSAVLDAFEPYIDALADKLWDRFEQRRGRMVNQHDSELGPRKHREAVKRRLDNHEGGAGISPNGRNYLLTREAIREELAKTPRRRPESSARRTDQSPDAGSTPARSRARELGDFERELMRDLRNVKD